MKCFVKEYIKGNLFLYQSVKILLHLRSFPFDAYRIAQEDLKSINILGRKKTFQIMFFKISSLLAFDTLRHHLMEKKHKIIKNFLEENFTILPQNKVPPISHNPYRQNIWVCWLQGENNAPDLVKVCLRQIRVHSNGHDVVLVDLSNLNKYVDVPENILKKYKSGYMLPAHFSDYIRYQILYRYGGAWLDATIFVTQDIGRDNEFCYDLYSAHYKIPQDDNCIARSRWVTPLFFCKEGSGFMYNTYKIFEKYHQTYVHCIDYLLIDYIMDFVVASDDDYFNLVNSIPTNNDDFQRLYRSFPLIYDKTEFEKMLDSDTYFYKLTYKHVPKYFKEGKLTYYGHIMKNF